MLQHRANEAAAACSASAAVRRTAAASDALAGVPTRAGSSACIVPRREPAGNTCLNSVPKAEDRGESSGARTMLRTNAVGKRDQSRTTHSWRSGADVRNHSPNAASRVADEHGTGDGRAEGDHESTRTTSLAMKTPSCPFGPGPNSSIIRQAHTALHRRGDDAPEPLPGDARAAPKRPQTMTGTIRIGEEDHGPSEHLEVWSGARWQMRATPERRRR